MVTKHLSEFYSHKAVLTVSRPVVADPTTPLEHQIQAHIVAGHQAFFQSKYAQARDEYLAAWGLLPSLVYPLFPAHVGQFAELKLLALDLHEPLLATSVAMLRRQDLVGPPAPIAPALNPPPALVALTATYVGKHERARKLTQLGVVYARMGEPELAEARIGEARELGAGDAVLEADGAAALATINLARRNFGGARAMLSAAGELYREADRPDGVAAMQHNLGVVRTMAGDAPGAAEHFIAAAVDSPLAATWSVTQTLNPGIASITRPMGQAGLPLLLADGGGWAEASALAPVQTNDVRSVLRDGAVVELDLRVDGAGKIERELLVPRIGAKKLLALDPHFVDAARGLIVEQFVSYLSHVRDFDLPLALADAYAELGDFERATTYYVSVRDYQFLNLVIERPVVWCRLARTYLRWGYRLYRDRDPEGARAKFEKIVCPVDGDFKLSKELYEGGFAPLTEETLAFLQAADRLTATTLDDGRRIILLEALAQLTQIRNKINYLGFPDDIIPIHPWRYLQNVARYFTGQAIQAERTYVNFKSTAEKEAFTRLSLEQAVDAQAAALEVERRRVDVANEQRRVAGLTAELAKQRADNAVAQRRDHAETSPKLAYFDEIMAFTNASDRKVRLTENWAAALGIELKKTIWPFFGPFFGQQLTYDTFQGNQLVQLMTRNRSQITRDYELRSQDRKIAEVNRESGVANAQFAMADRGVEVAEAQRDLADVRLQQARAQLTFFNAQEFTTELWDNLARAQRELSRRYLDWAIGAAFLMEQAFNTEHDTKVRRIRFDYERSELHGLLAADFLLADIDQFSYERLLETEKRLPIKASIALADRYPHQFRHQFQQTGRIDFQTFLDDFDRWQPGTFLRKLRRVEVVVEGLVGPDGLHGTLTNAGISLDRGRDGGKRRRFQQPETLVLSRFDLRGDGFVFAAGEEEELAVFENSGVASGWLLAFPPESNDLDFQAITNVHLVLYFDASYRDDVADVVRAELAATAAYEHTLGIGVRFQFPDEFFALQDTGAVTFTIDEAFVPYDQTFPLVRDLHLTIETVEGTPSANLVVDVALAGGAVSATQSTDANGMLSTDDAAAPLHAFRGKGLTDTWTVTIDRAANAEAFAAGFGWDKVKNIYLFAEYTYTPRGRAAVSDAFDADPLAAFEVVDDARATVGAPSNWTYDATVRSVVQTSSIRSPDGAAGLNADLDKPGTYLVARPDSGWPPLRDVVLRCRLSSGTGAGIGVVFRYRDADNFGFFLMDAERRYRRLGKKAGGVFRELETPAVDTEVGYEIDREYELTVAAVGAAIKVYLDNEEILSGTDRSLAEPGRHGFYAWGNAAARFLDLSVRPV